MLHRHVIVRCAHLAERFPEHTVVFFRIAAGFQLLMTQRRRRDMQNDESRPTISGQRTCQLEGSLGVVGKISWKEDGVNRQHLLHLSLNDYGPDGTGSR